MQNINICRHVKDFSSWLSNADSPETSHFNTCLVKTCQQNNITEETLKQLCTRYIPASSGESLMFSRVVNTLTILEASARASLTTTAERAHSLHGGIGVLTFRSCEEAREAARVLHGKTIRVDSSGQLVEEECGSGGGTPAKRSDVRNVTLIVKPAVRCSKEGSAISAARNAARLDRLRDYHCAKHTTCLSFICSKFV